MSSPKRYHLKAPSTALFGVAIQCEVTGRLLRVGEDGILGDLSEEQAAAFAACGFEPIEGRAVLDLRRLADAYARAAAAFATAEDAATAAIRFARLEGVEETAIEEILSSAGKAHQTVLPSPTEIAGGVPAAEKKAPAPAVEPPAAKDDAQAPEKKQPGGKKSLSASAQEAAAKKAVEPPSEAPAPAVEPPAPDAPQE